MSTRRRALCCTVVLVSLGALCVSAAQTDGLDAGVYTDEQASRGKSHYEAFCASCHVGDLGGTLAADTGAPPLRGAPFMASLEKKGVAAVFDYVKTTMPYDDPASLREAEYLDILAFLIQANGFPGGARELTGGDIPRLRMRSTSGR